jgi:hypothetical protein
MRRSLNAVRGREPEFASSNPTKVAQHVALEERLLSSDVLSSDFVVHNIVNGRATSPQIRGAARASRCGDDELAKLSEESFGSAQIALEAQNDPD